MLSSPGRRSGRRLPPGTVLIAAASAGASALPPALYAWALLALAAGSLPPGVLVGVAGAVGLALGMVAGAALLVLGRSWLVLAVVAAVLLALTVAAYLAFDPAAGLPPFWVVALLLPALTAALAVLPASRRWVASRRRVVRGAG
jgi:hypothetical protein